MFRPKKGSLVNYQYDVPLHGKFNGWGRIVGSGRFPGMGRVIHVLPFDQMEAIPICLKLGEVHARRST